MCFCNILNVAYDCIACSVHTYPHRHLLCPSEEHIRVSLISAVGDRLREKLREKYGDAQAEVAVLKQQKTDLERGRDKLKDMLAKLNNEQVGLSVSSKYFLFRVSSDLENLEKSGKIEINIVNQGISARQ